MSLPSGYKRLEYIQSTGTQYINTGVIIGPSNYDKTKFSVTAEKIGSGSGTNTTTWMLDGASASNYSFFYIGVSNGSVYYGCGSQDINSGISYAGGKCIFTLDAKNAKVSVTGHDDISATIASVDNNVPIYLFGFYANETTIYRHAEKIYRCQIFENDVLIRDFIPCQTTDGEIGLWDDVNSVFYGNDGTGTFTAGSVIAIAADVLEITKLEYIQSSGTQWIDTGFKPNQDTRVVMNCYVISFNSCDMFLFGARVSAGNTAFYIAADDTNERWYVSYGNEVLNPSGTCIGHHSIDMNKNSVSIDDAITTLSASTFQSASNLLLFATNTAGSADSQRGTMKLYSCQIYDNGTIIRDYISAKLSDGTVGLYDKLSGLLYINAGTGTFEAGPSSLNLPVNIGGTWKEANEAFVNIGGTWKTVKDVFVNIGGTWKELG